MFGLLARPGITDRTSVAFKDESEIMGEAIDPEVAYRTDLLPRKPVYSRACVREPTFCCDMAINLTTVKALLSRNG